MRRMKRRERERETRVHVYIYTHTTRTMSMTAASYEHGLICGLDLARQVDSRVRVIRSKWNFRRFEFYAC